MNCLRALRNSILPSTVTLSEGLYFESSILIYYRERMFELRRIQHGDRAVSTGETAQQLEEFFARDQNATIRAPRSEVSFKSLILYKIFKCNIVKNNGWGHKY